MHNSKRAMFLEQMKNKNMRSKNVSLCPIMAVIITFLNTPCYVGARAQTKELLTAIGEKKKKEKKRHFSANYNISVYLETETDWQSYGLLSNLNLHAPDYVT